MIITSVIIIIFKAAWHVQFQTYIARKPGGKCKLWEDHVCVYGHVPTFCFLLIFFLLYSLYLKTQPECQLFKHDLKEQRNYSIMFMISLKHTELEIIRRNVASHFSFAAQLYTHFWRKVTEISAPYKMYIH